MDNIGKGKMHLTGTRNRFRVEQRAETARRLADEKKKRTIEKIREVIASRCQFRPRGTRQPASGNGEQNIKSKFLLKKMSDSVPWFPEDWQSTEEQSTQEGVEEKQKPPVKKIRIKKSIPWVPEPPPPRAYKRQTHFTKEELEEKKKKAIAEEAERKAKKREENREKEEARWIELGRAICEISPEDVGLNDQNEEEFDPEWTGEEVVSSVHTFMNNLKKLIGPEQAKGTVLANCLTLTAAVCSVNQKSVVYIDQRIERIRKLKEEAAMKEIAEKQRLEEHWTEIGRAFCALSPEDVGIHRRHRKTPPADSEFSEVNGEDVVSNVFHFSMALKQLMGTHSKDTCFRSPFEVTSVIANVAEKTVRDRHPLHTLKAPADF